MQGARQELQLTQKDVAQKVNEKPSVIQEYESGRAIPSPQVLGKLERVLKVKLRGLWFSVFLMCVALMLASGADIGKKLEGPKK